MRKPFLAGNWKMNLDLRQAKSLAEEIREAVSGVTDRDIALFPTFVSVAQLAESMDGTNVKIGGQNIYFEADGAFTGEISASILRSTGATHVILGHSERRHVLGEDDATVNRKMKAALQAGLHPILCVGETLDEREAGTTTAVITTQVREGLAGIKTDDMASCTIAYEPVWAIGTGKTATPEMAQEVHAHIRSVVCDLFDRAVAEDIRIQYGGSVKPNNVDELMSMADIDGALVGGASMNAESFARIVKFKQK
ncbi:MAG: triosephosphate isomerase [Planctomycetota bacterium]|jgi:triosephosphate isomerase